MKIEQLKIKNFKALRDVEMRDIPGFCVIVGANGTGKSTLFNVFAFLQEAMRSDVQHALVNQGGNRGVAEARSRGSDGDIEIELKFRAQKGNPKRGKNPLITYSLNIGEESGRTIVSREVLKYRRGNQGGPWEFLRFASGSGEAVTNEGLETVKSETDLKREKQQLKADNILAIKGLAQFNKFPATVALGELIDRWHLSDIHIADARTERLAGAAEHLSREGENLSLVIDYLHKNHPQVMSDIVAALKLRIPGIVDVSASTIETGHVLLKIQDESFQEPFLVRYMSDGTIKMLAYLALLYDPNPHGLLCVEEPENQLYPRLLGELAEEFESYADRGSQVMVSTHSPEFLNAVDLDAVFMLVKKDGYTTLRRARDDEQLQAHIEKGAKLGELWKEGWFGGVDP